MTTQSTIDELEQISERALRIAERIAEQTDGFDPFDELLIASVHVLGVRSQCTLATNALRRAQAQGKELHK